jgi:arabinogalactan endo-1,4-beta-galactosidase
MTMGILPRTLIRKLAAGLLAIALAFACVLGVTDINKSGSAEAAAAFANGADISWVPGMEAQGRTWKDKSGNTRDIIDILKNDYGINSVRIRVFVNPSSDYANGYLTPTRAAQLAQRAQNAGMRVMLTLHYSDSWADPGKQNKPAAWSSLTFQQLMDQVWTYTRSVMTTMQSYGVTPEWVQVGNETSDGMLWPTGKASTNMQNYAYLVTTGHNAVKSVSSTTKTVVHLANGNDNAVFRWNIGGLVANGAQFDVIGMSLYPTASNWQTMTSYLAANMQDMIATYGKEIIVAEVGMKYSDAAASKLFVADTVAKTKALGANGLGVFYWEPEAPPGYNDDYQMGAWNADGTPTVALEGFGMTPGAAASTSINTSTWYKIVNRNSGKVLDVMDFSLANGAQIIQYDYLGGQNQQWKFTATSSGYYTITNRQSGKVMDIEAKSTADGAHNVQWTSNGGANQQWKPTLVSGSYFTIANRNSGKVMDIEASSTANVANNIQWASNGGWNQQWSLVPVG